MSKYNNSSQVLSYRAKGWTSKRVFQENKARQIFRITNISYPLIRTRTCAYQEVRNVRFSENLTCFVFLKDPFWDSPFCLVKEEARIELENSIFEGTALSQAHTYRSGSKKNREKWEEFEKLVTIKLKFRKFQVQTKELGS